MTKQSKSPDTTEPPKKQEGSLRWWEFYAVRYAVGTVLGASLFYFLCSSNSVLKPLLSAAVPASTDSAKFDSTDAAAASHSGPAKLDSIQLSLLAAYGFVYCYVASAPILVFHAGRFLLKLDTPSRTWYGWFLFTLIPPVVPAIVTWCCFTSASRVERWFYSIAWFVTALILWLQVIVVVRTLSKNKELYLFYQKLAARQGQRA